MHKPTLARKSQGTVIHSGKSFLDDLRTYLHLVVTLLMEEAWDLPQPTLGLIGGVLPD